MLWTVLDLAHANHPATCVVETADGRKKIMSSRQSQRPANILFHLPKFWKEIIGESDVFIADRYYLVARLSSNLIDSPQPQASTTFGFRNLKPDSSKLTS